MILFKGRSSLKQYNPKKSIKRGYKLWSMADIDGYLFKFEIYKGKNNKCTDHTIPKYFGLGENVVYQMTKSLQGKYYEVYIENYFTSVPLLEYLFSHHVMCCGTLRIYRKYLPKNLCKDKNLKRGDFDYRVSKDNIVVYKWMDNRPVHVISNFHGTEKTEIKRNNKDGSIVMISCSQAVKGYNTYIGGKGCQQN
ncbi:piggyBac transposable element-derived protein 3-like [Hydra vulgaris]|uniref:piggyBac transposable element-derived protein 3-like n=1 Tax=Hydra vulgaris TaxID=6087 RepID=UPI0002B47321|nr:piggyBac transposable element-derived protein 3-like [Hydra vulgaris]